MTSLTELRPSRSDPKPIFRFPYCTKCAGDTKHKHVEGDAWRCCKCGTVQVEGLLGWEPESVDLFDVVFQMAFEL
jgi:ribosomal protein L37AE/L43A